jgi:hypothetical protein
MTMIERPRRETIASDLKYLLVQPYDQGPHRFEHATVVSTHPTADGAFAALERYAERMEEQGIRPDAIELFVVDRLRRLVQRGD